MTRSHGRAPRAARARAAGIAVVVAAATQACAARARPPAPAPVDPVTSSWTATLDGARAALAAGRAARADTLLSAFRERYRGLPQSDEALYWRALVRLDAPAPSGGMRPALADLDAYLASTAPDHRAEVNVLRRLVMELDSAQSAPPVVERVPAPARITGVPRDTLRARDEELQRARADAAAVRAELDRVRRRLAAPGRRVPASQGQIAPTPVTTAPGSATPSSTPAAPTTAPP
ncbi:hypothetical protein tb265_28480 [Gemmatimonadetes bacterium T265]|nr:hypothetical protein tb265_28480 [Gemmatimonadetes bacterium T265]